MYLDAVHFQVARRDCDHCQKYRYDEHTGVVVMRHRPFQDQPQLRIATNPPPCRAKGMSCPKGTPENSRELSAKNRRALRFHDGCKATGRWPADDIVQQNAAIIETVERSLRNFDRWNETQRHRALTDLLAAALRSRIV